MFYLFYLYPCSLFGELCLLVSWYASGRSGIVGSDEDRGRSRRPDVEDQEWSYMSSIRWSNDREIG
jgi:hypothetical protein